MKLGVLIIMIVLAFGVLAVNVSAAGSETLCRKDCLTVQKEELRGCNAEYGLCNGECERNSTCKRICSLEKMVCMREKAVELTICQKDCKIKPNAGCLNNSYVIGQKFKKGCELCECKTGGNVSCKKDLGCNENSDISRVKCEIGGGLYQGICNGNYFDMFCSQEKFCICGGFKGYSCGEGYECKYDFVPPKMMRKNTVSGWTNVLGIPLGDVGICVEKNNTLN